MIGVNEWGIDDSKAKPRGKKNIDDGSRAHYNDRITNLDIDWDNAPVCDAACGM